jgi:hypothetical protein
MTGSSFPPSDRAVGDPAQPTAEITQRRPAVLQRNSAGISVMLLIQYGLGMGVNLYVQVPRRDQGAGAATALGRTLTSPPDLLAAHAAFGLLMIIAAINVLARAIRTRRPPLIAASAAGLAAILAAGASGASFASNGQASSSLAMALLTGIALLCYLVNLFIPVRIARPVRNPPSYQRDGGDRKR